jgi:hypothetical protein
MDLLFREHAEALVGLIARSEKMDSSTQEYMGAVEEIVRLAKKLDTIEALSFPGSFGREIESRSEGIFRKIKGFHEEVESIEVAMREGSKMLEEAEIEVEGSVVERILEHGRVLSRYAVCPPFWSEGHPLGERLPAVPTEELLQQSVLGIQRPVELEKKYEKRKESPEKEAFSFEI